MFSTSINSDYTRSIFLPKAILLFASLFLMFFFSPAIHAGKIIATPSASGAAGFGGWNLDNVDVILNGTGSWYEESDGSYYFGSDSDFTYEGQVSDGISEIMGKVLAKDWPVGEPSGIKVINDDPAVKAPKPPNCIMATSYLAEHYLDSADPRQVICSSPFQTHKRYKLAMLPATVDGGVDSIDLVFNVEAETGARQYQVFQKINNWTNERLDGFTVQVGFGVGENFKSVTNTDTVALEDLNISVPSDIWEPTQLATFSAGLFGPLDKHTGEVGFFDPNIRAGFLIDEYVADGVQPLTDIHHATRALGSNYAEVPAGAAVANQFGNWLPNSMLPYGIFFDDDGNPETDAVLVAWYAYNPDTDAFGWMSGSTGKEGDTIPQPSDPVTMTLSFQDGAAPDASYSGTRDTSLFEYYPDTVYGSSTELDIDGDSPHGTGNDVSAMLRWDTSTIPAGSVVESVEITVEVINPTTGEYGIYALRSPWDESEATWDEASSGVSWQSAGASGSLDRGSVELGTVGTSELGSYSFSLNSDGLATVQGWVDNPLANYGLIITDNSVTNGMDFRSREAAIAVQRPKLTITYTSSAPNAEDSDDDDDNGSVVPFSAYSSEEIQAMGAELSYTMDVIDDLVNVGLNYLVTIGDLSPYSSFTIRVTPTADTSGMLPPTYVGVTPDPLLLFTSSDAKVLIQPEDEFTVGSLLTARVGDTDLNLDPTTIDEAVVSISTDSGLTATLTLEELGENRGVFAATLPDEFSQVDAGTVVTVTYVDANTGEAVNVTKTSSTTAIPEVPPILSDVSIREFEVPEEVTDGRTRNLEVSIINDHQALEAATGSVLVTGSDGSQFTAEFTDLRVGGRLKFRFPWTATLSDPAVEETVNWTATVLVNNQVVDEATESTEIEVRVRRYSGKYSRDSDEYPRYSDRYSRDDD